ncbi:MAG: hypothetical protein WCK67_02025 [bacterium]
MMKIKKILFCSSLLLSVLYSNAVFSSPSDKVKSIIPRIGLNGMVEYNKVDMPAVLPEKIKDSSLQKGVPSLENNLSKEINYTDFDIKQLAKEVKWGIDDTKTADLENLRVLWQATVAKSETLRFAIYKLSNPNGEEQKKSIVKKILSPLASVTPILGMGASNVIAGSSTILGGSLLSSVLSDDSFVNNKLSRVTDTELVLLAQQTDNLQSTLVKQYYDYKNALERLDKIDEIVKNRYDFYLKSQNKSVEQHSIADVFYRESTDLQFQAKQDALKARASLEQLVGNDALVEAETKFKQDVSTK